jgi:hypothetical protein
VRGRRKGVKYPFQGTVATTNGADVWLFRYSSEGKSRSLFFSRDLHTLRELCPHREILHDISDDARLIVSEPVGDLPGAWNEMPESSWGVTGRGYSQPEPFAPKTSAWDRAAGVTRPPTQRAGRLRWRGCRPLLLQLLSNARPSAQARGRVDCYAT